MAEVIYMGEYPEVVLPDGTVCVNGEPVFVDDETGINLARQEFLAVDFTDPDDIPDPDIEDIA